MSLENELKTLKEYVNNELDKYFNNEKCPEYILNSSMKYSLMAGGKRLRPILMLKTYELFKDNKEECLPFAIALEMIHNFSLIHDDLPVIDNDDFRHGISTNHKKFGEATAILAGDGLLNFAYVVISNSMTNNENILNKTKAFNEFSIAVDRMIAGEYIDTECEKKEITAELLEYIHNNKTGALLKASIRIGAILGGATQEELKDLTEYANKIGLAFQIKDDILSEIADEKVLGKPVGNDKKKGKSTFVTKYGLNQAKEKLDEVINDAKKSIKCFEDKNEFFVDFAEYMINRNK